MRIVYYFKAKFSDPKVDQLTWWQVGQLGWRKLT